MDPVTAFSCLLASIRDEYIRTGRAATVPDINQGLCEHFALDVVDRWPHGGVQVMDDHDFGRFTWLHKFVRYGGRFYDAEAVEGVQDWRDLPLFAAEYALGGSMYGLPPRYGPAARLALVPRRPCDGPDPDNPYVYVPIPMDPA